MLKLFKEGILLIFMVFISSDIFSQEIILPSNADSAYSLLEKSLDVNYPDYIDTVKFGQPNYFDAERIKFIAGQVANRKYRNLGIEFWFRFPNDVRRYIWFDKTVQGGVMLNYWMDLEQGWQVYSNRENGMSTYEVPLDYVSLWKWEKMYPILKREYLRFADMYERGKRDNVVGDLSFRREEDFSSEEVATFFNLSRNRSYRVSEKLSTVVVEDLILDQFQGGLKKKSLSNTSVLKNLNGYLLSGYKYWGWNEDSIDNMLNNLLEIKGLGSEFSIWIKQTKNLMNLFKSPMQLRFKLPSGELFDLQEWKTRDSIVLVDIWSLSCGSCIGRMPYLNKLFEKYKGQGFTVLSLCAVDEKDRSKVDSIQKELNLSWKTILIGRAGRDKTSIATKLCNEYGYNFVPQMFLLDRSGKVVLYNNQLVSGDFESLLQGLLAMHRR